MADSNNKTGTLWGELLLGTDEAETIDGAGGGDIIDGSGGNDSIDGGAGDDSIGGNEGNDTIDGGAGEDLIFGSAGDDSLTGGADTDTDTFAFSEGHGNDTITDFTDAEDTIDLSALTDITQFSDLTITSGNDGVTIDLTGKGGGTILLAGADENDIDAADFNFYEAPVDDEN